MAIILKNERVVLHVDLPEESYRQPRFDWTGKITRVTFEGTPVTGFELRKGANEEYGQGFYNEFGIKTAIGFEEVDEGGWFHKIGVGLLQKQGPKYQFHVPHVTRPAAFEVKADDHQIGITCRSEVHEGYAYELRKTIRLTEDGFDIDYRLDNVGKKAIVTEEYCHNFLAIDKKPMGADYQLSFPFELMPDQFDETLNPKEVVRFAAQALSFNKKPKGAFFFSNLSGGKHVHAHWTLEQRESRLGISETGNFQTSSINLWGMGHVISPELFISINVAPGMSQSWTRAFDMFRMK
ncbi:MAG: hypothetical protein AAGA85_14835 [Bacteroidota bacterium]